MSNLALFAFGTYIYYVHGAFRFVIVYSILNIILYGLFNKTHTGERLSSKNTTGAFIFNIITIITAFLLVVLGAIMLQSIYVRPHVVSILAGLILSFTIIILIETIVVNVFNKMLRITLFVYALLTLLYIYLSIYLVQPSILSNVPSYATVDAYRDYVNANRLLKLARIIPEYMVLENYYKVFPVVPLWLAIINLVSNLSIPAIHMVLAILNITLIFVSLILLSRAAFKTTYKVVVPQISLLTTLLLLLYPTLIDPMFTLTPLMFSVPLISLCIFISLKTVLKLVSLKNILLILIFLCVIIPLHATTSILMITFFMFSAIFFRRRTISNLFSMFTAVSAILFIVYTVFSSIPFIPVYGALKAVFQVLMEAFTAHNVIFEKVSEAYVHPANEVERFFYALSNAYLPSFLTVLLVVSLEELLKYDHINYKLHLRIVIFYGIASLLAFVLGYVVQSWKIDFRYFLFSTIPLVAVTLTMLFMRISNDLKFFKKLAILTILLAIMFSIVLSPQFLHEVNPHYARLIPTDSEKHTGVFVTAFIDYDGHGVRQVVSDWPYYAYVRALIWSQNIGVEHHIKIPTLMYEAIVTINDTLFILRNYFYESITLQKISPHVELLVKLRYKCNTMTKIFDIGSTSIYFISN